MQEKTKNWWNQNWLKIIIAIAVLIVAISAGYYFVVFLPKQQENNQLIKNNVDAQQKCTDEAKIFFNEDKWGRAAEDINSSNVNYTNHYNSKYNKCFVLITERFSDGSGTSQVLYDVLEHKEYANGTFGSKDFSIYCTILNGDCKTASDFNKFISEYMEENLK